MLNGSWKEESEMKVLRGKDPGAGGLRPVSDVVEGIRFQTQRQIGTNTP